MVILDDSIDQTLLNKLATGDADAATALYLRYARKLEEFANSKTGQDVRLQVDPEGVVHSVFRTFFRRASEGRYAVAEGEDLWKLLLVIALNKIRNRAAFHRAQKRNVNRTIHLDPGLLNEGHRDQQAYAILKMTIEELLEAMTPIQKQIVNLRIQGEEVTDIARQAATSKRTVERTLQKFRQKLSDIIGEDT